MLRTVEMEFEFNNIITAPPVNANQLYHQACSNDGITIASWRNQWIAQIKDNHAKYGPFKNNSIGQLHKLYHLKPAIVVGSGPSLRNNGEMLKRVKGIPVISCLHNFHFFVDHNLPCDYFVSLDAGDVTIEELYEGGTKSKEEYFEATKNYTLLAFIGSNPKLLEIWKGKVLFFNCPVPDVQFQKEVTEIERFNMLVSTGGNVLGACTYIAKAILGCNPLCFLGADFSFSYTKKFHGWDSKYDKSLGNAIRAVDVWGHKVYTWQSYYNFKSWFDWLSMTVPGLYINCTEGGLFGAYPEGNLYTVQQMLFDTFLKMYELPDEVVDACRDPDSDPNEKKIKILF